jgi:hypothetical protein
MKNTGIKYFSFIALFAFLLNVMLPFFAVYNPASASDAPAIDGKILICSGDGFKWVKLSDLQSGKEVPAHTHYKCALCYVAAHGVKATPVSPALNIREYQLQINSVAYFEAADFSNSLYSISRINPRAPPFFVG